MKVLIGAAVAALFFALPAAAQTSPTVSPNCSGFVAAPTLPDGADATQAAMTEANTAYQTWGQERIAKLALCRAEIEALRAQLAPLEEGYRGAGIELNATVASWEAEVAEFNAREPQGSRRPRAGILTH
jgi:hypothetical protein